MNSAFDYAEKKFGIVHLLESKDVKSSPDTKTIFPYVFMFYEKFGKEWEWVMELKNFFDMN
jgi:hypothetical protein